MSSTYLKDPRNGDALKINKEGRAQVTATTQSLIGARSDFFGRSYTTYGKILLASTANENFFYLHNDSTDHMHISSMTFSSPATAIKIEVYTDVTFTSGGYNLQTGGTTSQVKNLNLGSGNTPTITALDGRLNDLVCTVPADNEILDVRLTTGFTTFTYRFDDALIIPRNHNILVLCAGAIGDKVRVATQFFFEESHSS